jgi:hypothetical protein
MASMPRRCTEARSISAACPRRLLSTEILRLRAQYTDMMEVSYT